MSTNATLGTVGSAGPPPAKMTYEEFLEWHPDAGMAEWVNGEAFVMAPPATVHQRLAYFLARCISSFSDRRGLGEVFIPPFQMRLSGSGREPDVVFVGVENLSRVGEQYLSGPADLVVEVVSPDSRRRDRVEKLAEYEQAGVREYWVVDPIRRRAEFYVLGNDGRFRQATYPDGVFHSRVLPGMWLKVEWLWQTPLPTLPAVLQAWNLG
jgi:Uma2 family endonuclease